MFSVIKTFFEKVQISEMQCSCIGNEDICMKVQSELYSLAKLEKKEEQKYNSIFKELVLIRSPLQPSLVSLLIWTTSPSPP